jgi:putative SOS response-associated peptidase YedK
VDERHDNSMDDKLKSCAMVITEPNKFVAEVCDRMPIILEAKDFEQWERGDVKDAAALMKPAEEEVLQRWAVSKRVNSSRAPDDDPTLIEPAVVAKSENPERNNRLRCSPLRRDGGATFSARHLLLRDWRCGTRKRNRRRCVVPCDLHRLAFVRRQEAAKGHANEKHCEDRQYYYAVVSRRSIKSPHLLVQKFLIVLVHLKSP